MSELGPMTVDNLSEEIIDLAHYLIRVGISSEGVPLIWKALRFNLRSEWLENGKRTARQQTASNNQQVPMVPAER